MPTYRVRPGKIEAEQWGRGGFVTQDTGQIGDRPEPDWIAAAFKLDPTKIGSIATTKGSILLLRTALGIVMLVPDDWLLRSRSGSLFKMTNLDFQTHYERVCDAVPKEANRDRSRPMERRVLR